MEAYPVGKFASEILLLGIGTILAYIALKIRTADSKLDKIERTMFGLDEVDQEQGIVQMVHTHRDVLKAEGILEDEADELTLDNIDKLIKKLQEADSEDFNNQNNAD